MVSLIICNEDGSQNTYLDESVVECIQQANIWPAGDVLHDYGRQGNYGQRQRDKTMVENAETMVSGSDG